MKSIIKISTIIIAVFISNIINYPLQIPQNKISLINLNINKIDSVYKFYKDKLNVYKYPIRERLPLIKVHNIDTTQTLNSNKINIKVELPHKIKYANIYLFINKEKIDLYSSVKGGEYTFRNVRLRNGKNNIEIFYTLGNIRSSSTSIIINNKL
ncbi:MAG: hypothetical protein IIB83_04960 [Bacteroidetes bacterium]|nr:hypothetical protein [Bacteroidota bacterium]MCH8325896.1 hypothetical protein [Bacteroidota bacterium]